jgi:hypothetical protein
LSVFEPRLINKLIKRSMPGISCHISSLLPA